MVVQHVQTIKLQMLDSQTQDPKIDLDAEILADKLPMSTAKKIGPEVESTNESEREGLPPIPNTSLLKLVAMDPTSDLPATPRVKIKPKVRSRNLFLIVGLLMLLFTVVAGTVAMTLYLVMTGVIDIQPSEIKQFLKAITFK